tara:strand:+ start:175 stop:312 length:138 start_codon:yes stop_codon:yes gene_type:complete
MELGYIFGLLFLIFLFFRFFRKEKVNHLDEVLTNDDYFVKGRYDK